MRTSPATLLLSRVNSALTYASFVVWITAPPTQAFQRSVASTINPNAASTANNGIARRPQGLREPGGHCGVGAFAAAAAGGEDGVDPV
jgi:hypothetical protein